MVSMGELCCAASAAVAGFLVVSALGLSDIGDVAGWVLGGLAGICGLY